MSCSPVFAQESKGPNEEYRSPYRLELPHKTSELIPDLLHGERGNPHMESEIPFREWYQSKHPRFGSWGPAPRLYPVPALSNGKSADWKRARILATAIRFQGYHYRHHHIPDWDPPQGYSTPGEKEPAHAGKGVDCSNFTSFVYNQGLGYHLNSDVHKQSEITRAEINGTRQSVPIKTIPLPRGLENAGELLLPGDLIYVRGSKKSEKITHVIIWVGKWGVSPDGTPLIIDSHGSNVKDCEDTMIPSGIHLRPVRRESWYAECAHHAHRLIE